MTREITEEKATRRLNTYVDVYERKDDVVVVADLPGVTQETVDVTIDKDLLTIHGTTKGDADTIYEYERSFTISERAQKDKITAKVTEGVLTVTVPYAQEAKAKKIPISNN